MGENEYEIEIAILNGKLLTFGCISGWWVYKHCLCLSWTNLPCKYIPIENIEYFIVKETDMNKPNTNCPI